MKTIWQLAAAIFIGAAVVLGTGVPAQAGYWVVAGYQYARQTRSDSQVYRDAKSTPRSQHEFPSFAREITPRNESGFHPVAQGGESFGCGANLTIAGDEFHNRFFAGYALARLTITPVFRWEANRLYTDANSKGAPDSVDTPPGKLWYYEQSDASTLHTNAHFAMREVNNGLGSKIVTSHPGGSGVTLNRASTSQVVVQDTQGATTVYGQSRSLIVRVNLTATGIASKKTGQNTASARVSYAVDLVQFRLMSRLKANHDPTDFHTGFNNRFDISPAGAHIAAGGIETPTHEHEADFVIRVSKSTSGTPLSGLPRGLLPRLRVRNREGVVVPVEIRAQANTTNSNGLLLSDTALSRDTMTGSSTQDPRPVDAYLSNVTNSSPTRLFMEWDQNDDWTFDAVFIKPNAQLPVTFRPKFNDLPITGHSLKFIVAKILVSGYDPAVDEERTRYYTSDPAEVDAEASPPVLLGPIETYAKFDNPVATDSGGGVYQNTLRLRPPEDQLVEDVEFQAEDKGVFGAPTP